MVKIHEAGPHKASARPTSEIVCPHCHMKQPDRGQRNCTSICGKPLPERQLQAMPVAKTGVRYGASQAR